MFCEVNALKGNATLSAATEMSYVVLANAHNMQMTEPKTS